jgi:hypothetical protein
MKSEGTRVSGPSLPWEAEDWGATLMQEGAKKGKRSRRSTEGDRVEAEIQNLHAMRAGIVFARLGPIA